MHDKTLLLNKKQIEQRINRIAYQIYEDNFEEKEIFIVGILKSGFTLAEKIEAALHKICDIKTHLVQLKIDKRNHISVGIEIELLLKYPNPNSSYEFDPNEYNLLLFVNIIEKYSPVEI